MGNLTMEMDQPILEYQIIQNGENDICVGESN